MEKGAVYDEYMDEHGEELCETYLQNGTCIQATPFCEKIEDFFVQKLKTPLGIEPSVAGYFAAYSTKKEIFYRGDELAYVLDNELVKLYTTMEKLFFSGDQFAVQYSMPLFAIQAGLDSDCILSKEQTINMLKLHSKSQPYLNKFMYLNDCQYLIATIQHLIEALGICISDFYISLGTLSPLRGMDGTKTYFMCSRESTRIAYLIETYFTKAYSILDMLSKIAFEMEKPQENFEEYKKLKCSEKLWGIRNKLKINKLKDSVFEENCDTIMKIESIRNEVVHNGAWELRAKTFFRIESGKVVERFILFPDFEQGHLATFKNRRHFFSSDIRVNDVLPEIHLDFLRRVLKTVEHLNEMA